MMERKKNKGTKKKKTIDHQRNSLNWHGWHENDNESTFEEWLVRRFVVPPENKSQCATHRHLRLLRLCLVFFCFYFSLAFRQLPKKEKKLKKKKTQNPIVVFVLYSRRDPPVVDGEHPLLRIKIHQPTHHSFTGQRSDRERVRATVKKMNLSERSHLVQWGKVMGRKWIRWLPSCRRRRHLVFGFCCLFFIFVERTSSLFIPVIPIVLACVSTQEVPPTLRHKDKWRQL